MSGRSGAGELPTLRTERLTIRPLELADAARVQELAGARAIADTTANIPHPYPDGVAPEWIGGRAAAWDTGKEASWAIANSEGLIGGIGLRLHASDRRAELGYWLGVPYWGMGYATEASRSVLAFAFDTLDLNRVHACHLARNPASGRVLEKIGMRREGVFRQHETKWGVLEDLVMWGVLRGEEHR